MGKLQLTKIPEFEKTNLVRKILFVSTKQEEISQIQLINNKINHACRLKNHVAPIKKGSTKQKKNIKKKKKNPKRGNISKVTNHVAAFVTISSII